MAARGTGETNRQLAALPDGGVFIVHGRPLHDWCRQLLVQQGRRPDAVRLVVISDIFDIRRLDVILRETPVAVDHAFSHYATARVLAEINLRLSRQTPVTTN